MVDSSKGISREMWSDMLDYVRTNFDNSPISAKDTRVSLINFGSTARIELPLQQGSDKDVALMKLLDISRIGGQRNIEEGFKKAKEILLGKVGRPNAGKMIVTIVGGEIPENSLTATQAIISDLERRNIISAVIGFGDDVDKDDIKSISTSDKHGVTIKESKEFPSTVSVVSQAKSDAAGNHFIEYFSFVSSKHYLITNYFYI